MSQMDAALEAVRRIGLNQKEEVKKEWFSDPTQWEMFQINHVNAFYVGGYGNFDRLAGAAIIQLKKKYQNIHLYLVIPYHPAAKPIEAPAGYDGTFYPDGMENVSRRFTIAKSDRKMIETSDFLIAYVTHTVSNAHNLLEYAMRQQERGLIRVINLGEDEAQGR